MAAFAFGVSAGNATAPEAADLVILNANVRTMSERRPSSAAVAVRGNKIVFVGTTREARKLISSSTRVMDAKGRLLLPGFNDAHTHFIAIGNSFSSIDLRNAKTYGDAVSAIERYAGILPKGRWILGSAWTFGYPPGEEEMAALENAAPENPVLLFRDRGSSAWANKAATNLSGTGDLVDETTGIVRGPALAQIRRQIPPDHMKNWAEIAATATNYAASLGITSIQDVSADERSELYRELERSGMLKTRIYDCGPLPEWHLSLAPPSQAPDSMVRGGCLKGFYEEDPEEAKKLRVHAQTAYRNGWQIAVHAIGAKANSSVLGIFGGLKGQTRRRLRVEHAHDPSLADMRRFARLGIVASVQPHLFGGDRTQYRTMVDAGMHVAFGSDAPMTDFNPMLTIYAAVSGPTSLSVREAVYAYTVGSAYAEFQDAIKGTIEPGMLADLVVLSEDIFTAPPAGIPNVRVLMTIVNGRVVYEAAKMPV